MMEVKGDVFRLDGRVMARLKRSTSTEMAYESKGREIKDSGCLSCWMRQDPRETQQTEAILLLLVDVCRKKAFSLGRKAWENIYGNCSRDKRAGRRLRNMFKKYCWISRRLNEEIQAERMRRRWIKRPRQQESSGTGTARAEGCEGELVGGMMAPTQVQMGTQEVPVQEFRPEFQQRIVRGMMNRMNSCWLNTAVQIAACIEGAAEGARFLGTRKLIDEIAVRPRETVLDDMETRNIMREIIPNYLGGQMRDALEAGGVLWGEIPTVQSEWKCVRKCACVGCGLETNMRNETIGNFRGGSNEAPSLIRIVENQTRGRVECECVRCRAKTAEARKRQPCGQGENGCEHLMIREAVTLGRYLDVRTEFLTRTRKLLDIGSPGVIHRIFNINWKVRAVAIHEEEEEKTLAGMSLTI